MARALPRQATVTAPGRPPRASILGVGLFVVLAAGCSGRVSSRLDTSEGVAALSPAAASEGRQVRLHGVVVYSDRDSGRIFVQGTQAGVFVDLPRGEPSPDLGQPVEVTGTTARAEFYNVVAASGIREAEERPAPRPAVASQAALAAGAHAYAWVEVSGIVRATTIENDEKPSLLMAAPGGTFNAYVAERTGVDYESFVDARVRLRGLSHPIFDSNGRVVRLKLLVATVRDIAVSEPPPVDPFSVPLRSVASLRQLGADARAGHRVRVEGQLLEARHDGGLRVQDDTGVLEIRTGDVSRLSAGGRIEVVGFPSMDPASPRLVHALARRVGAAHAPARRDARRSVLTTVAQVHALAPQEAKKRHPVRLRGVVTYFDPTVPFTFLQDATGGIYLNSEGDGSLRLEAGQLVEAEGESDPGYFAPSVYRARFRVLGRAPMPVVPPLALEDLISGQQDSNWVEARGVVQSVEHDVRGRLHVVLAAGPQRFYATVQGYGSELPRYLVDARVAVRGACGAIFNEKRQLLGLNLYVPGPEALVVEERAPADPFALPLRSIDTLMRFVPGEKLGHRVRVRGVVTLQAPGESMYLRDDTGGLYVESRESGVLEPGTEVDVVGFAALGEYTPVLREAVFRTIAPGASSPAVAVTAEEAMSGNYHAQLVQVEARVLDSGRDVLTLQSGPYTFSAFLARPGAPVDAAALRSGSLVRLTGICLVQASRSQLAKAMRPRIESFRILLRSPEDVALLRRAPWWTIGRALSLLAAAGAVAAIAVAWVVLLRRRVNEAVRQLKVLRGLLPICAGCKKIRDDVGSWKQIEAYISEHSEVDFSHGLCPDCLTRLYPEFSARAMRDDEA